MKVDNAVIYDEAFVMHIGLDTVMAYRYEVTLMDTEALFVRGVDNSRPFKANSATSRDGSYQLHVTPTRT